MRKAPPHRVSIKVFEEMVLIDNCCCKDDPFMGLHRVAILSLFFVLIMHAITIIHIMCVSCVCKRNYFTKLIQYFTTSQQRFIQNCPSREQFVYTWEP